MNGFLRAIGHLAFWPAAALGAALVGWLVLAAAGVAPVRPPERAAAAATAVRAPAASSPVVEPEPEPAPVTTEVEPPAAPQPVTVTVTATRGESWIAARLGSESGRVLEERVLPLGETARLTGRRVWLLVGASANVDVRVNGEARELAPGTVETVFSAPVR